jgi:hypothetical protein
MQLLRPIVLPVHSACLGGSVALEAFCTSLLGTGLRGASGVLRRRGTTAHP